ncbi:MAG: hypothetical protein KF749_07820 [Bacteroidetes bacterium]|nr:hypothetical protein [Bacteroidota bacterium]MCW5894949.1 hypothetical protein [Bacteroidota bacterium]
MKYSRYFLVFLLPLIFLTSCKKDEGPTTTPPTQINEAEVLVQYLEGNGDYINVSAPSVVAASAVYQDLNATPPTQYIIDLRSSADFQGGHIQGAHNVALAGLMTHVKSVANVSSYNRLVIVCYTGQTSAYATSILRLAGYSNAISLKFGMCSWDSVFATTRWLASIGNSRAGQFVTTSTAKNAAGNLPTISTGKTNGADILAARIDTLLTRGYTEATVTNATLFGNLTGYYIVNYWPLTEYTDPGHIPGAIQYTPKSDLRLATNLKTLPTDKPIAVYCYTGQTSSFIAAYLRLLGYDAKSLMYGANAMIYDMMVAKNMTTFKAAEIMGYPYVTGP